MTVVVYTRQQCQPCNATKRKIAEFGIDPVLVSTDDDSPTTAVIVEELKADGFSESPVVKIIDDHGDYVDAWSGYRPDKIAEHLGDVRAA